MAETAMLHSEGYRALERASISCQGSYKTETETQRVVSWKNDVRFYYVLMSLSQFRNLLLVFN